VLLWLITVFFRLPKQVGLKFFVKSIDIPKPYDIYWKVRNFGEEAEKQDSLRGEIYKDDGSHTRTEGTAYTGLHFVECYIIKNNQCIAKGRMPVPIN